MGRRVPQQPFQLRAVAFAAVFLCIALSSGARAENVSGAELLFEAGRKALAEKDYDLACQKFQESNRLERAPGTLLNIANCEEKRGRLATSFGRYTEAMNMLGPEDPRYEFAKDNAQKLEKRVPRLTVQLAKDAPGGTTLTRSGKEWTRPLGSPLRLDPGNYVFIVGAPKHENARYEVTLGEGDIKELTVAPGPPLATTGPQKDERDPKRAGLIIGGAGAAAAIAGITFGVLTYVDYRTVERECDIDARTCETEKGEQAARRGGTFEILAYGLGAVGVTGLAVGGYLLLHENKERGVATFLEAGHAGGAGTVRFRATF